MPKLNIPVVDKPGDNDGSFSFRGPADEGQGAQPQSAAPSGSDKGLVSVGDVGGGSEGGPQIGGYKDAPN